MKESNLERIFDTLLEQICPRVSKPEKEYLFAKKIKRKWRFDRAWPDVKVAVELEGGVFSGGRHVRGVGFENDCVKYNTAQSMGWTVLRFTSNMLKLDAAQHLELLQWCLEKMHISCHVSDGA